MGRGKQRKAFSLQHSLDHFPLMSRLLLESCGAADRQARDARPRTERSPILSFSVRQSLFSPFTVRLGASLLLLSRGSLVFVFLLHDRVFDSASLISERQFTVLAPSTLSSRIPRHELLKSIIAPNFLFFFSSFFSKSFRLYQSLVLCKMSGIFKKVQG